MSAKRRQEAIARFSVPLSQTAGAPSASQATQAPAPATQSTQGKRPVRATRPARSVAVPQDAGSDSDDEYNPFGEAATSEAGPDPDVESEPEPEYVTRDSSDNPRVMLISLKAVSPLHFLLSPVMRYSFPDLGCPRSELDWYAAPRLFHFKNVLTTP